MQRRLVDFMMRWIAALAALAVASSAAPVDPAAVTRVAQTCTADGAFGHSFGETHVGTVTAKADSQWAPFDRLTMTATAKTYRTWTITAFASIGVPSDTLDKQIADAVAFLTGLDSAITASKRFMKREADRNYLRYRTVDDANAGVTLTMERYGSGIVLSCSDETLRSQADTENGGSQLEF